MKVIPCLILWTLLLTLASIASGAQQEFSCRPTPPDQMGPFYRPGAPLRSVIGSGYLLTGTVRSASDCAPLTAPLIEFWQAGPNGRYTDAYRAAIITGATGRYHIETSPAPPYGSRPPHIHVRVSAPGFKTLVTQHYPESGQTSAVFDLILIPAK